MCGKTVRDCDIWYLGFRSGFGIFDLQRKAILNSITMMTPVQYIKVISKHLVLLGLDNESYFCFIRSVKISN